MISESINISLTSPMQNDIDINTWNFQNETIPSCTFRSELESDIKEEFDQVNQEQEKTSVEKKDIDLLKSIFMMAGQILAPKENTSKDKINDILRKKNLPFQIEDTIEVEIGLDSHNKTAIVMIS